MKELTFKSRRHLGLLTTAVALATAALIVWIQETRLAHTSFFTGFTLLGTIVLLILLGVRRRLPVLAIGSVSNWTQVHLYAGLFSIGIYMLHVPALVGSGIFESTLSIVFLLVAASGFYGIYASRTIPKTLTAIDGEVRFDQLAWHRDQLANAASELLSNIPEAPSAEVIGRLYESELRPYFSTQPSISYLIAPSGKRRRNLLEGIKEIERYIESDGRAMAGRLAALVRRRDNVDYQHALQLRLRLWLVFHCVLSLGLLAGGLIHASIAWRFAG